MSTLDIAHLDNAQGTDSTPGISARARYSTVVHPATGTRVTYDRHRWVYHVDLAGSTTMFVTCSLSRVREILEEHGVPVAQGWEPAGGDPPRYG